jgi:hypothetical protein
VLLRLWTSAEEIHCLSLHVVRFSRPIFTNIFELFQTGKLAMFIYEHHFHAPTLGLAYCIFRSPSSEFFANALHQHTGRMRGCNLGIKLNNDMCLHLSRYSMELSSLSMDFIQRTSYIELPTSNSIPRTSYIEHPVCNALYATVA